MRTITSFSLNDRFFAWQDRLRNVGLFDIDSFKESMSDFIDVFNLFSSLAFITLMVNVICLSELWMFFAQDFSTLDPPLRMNFLPSITGSWGSSFDWLRRLKVFLFTSSWLVKTHEDFDRLSAGLTTQSKFLSSKQHRNGDYLIHDPKKLDLRLLSRWLFLFGVLDRSFGTRRLLLLMLFRILSRSFLDWFSRSFTSFMLLILLSRLIALHLYNHFFEINLPVKRSRVFIQNEIAEIPPVWLEVLGGCLKFFLFLFKPHSGIELQILVEVIRSVEKIEFAFDI